MEMSSIGSEREYGSCQKMKQMDLVCCSDNETSSYQKLKEQVIGIRMEDSACRVEISGRSEKAFCLNVEGLGFSVAALKHSMECSVELTGHKVSPQKRAREQLFKAQEKADTIAEIEAQPNDVLCKINNFEDKEINRFIQSYKRFPRPITRLEAIARDARLEGKPFSDLEQLGTRLQNGCHECVKEFQTKLNENTGDDLMKTIIPTFRLSGVMVKALAVLEKEAQLEPLVLSLPSDPQERKNYHINAPCRAVDNWNVPWDVEDDSRFLQGIYEYGMGRWHKIKMDPNLNLTDKLLIGFKKKKPQAADLWMRANYLLQVLQMQLSGEIENTEEQTKKTKEKKRQADGELSGEIENTEEQTKKTKEKKRQADGECLFIKKLIRENEEKEEPKLKKNKKREKKPVVRKPIIRLTRSNGQFSNVPEIIPSTHSGIVNSTAELSEQSPTAVSEKRPDTNLEMEDLSLPKVLNQQQQILDAKIEPTVRLTRSNVQSSSVPESIQSIPSGNVDSTAKLSEETPPTAVSEKRPDTSLETEDMFLQKILNQQQQILDNMLEVQDLVKNYKLAKLKIQSGYKPREVLAEFQLTF